MLDKCGIVTGTVGTATVVGLVTGLAAGGSATDSPGRCLTPTGTVAAVSATSAGGMTTSKNAGEPKNLKSNTSLATSLITVPGGSSHGPLLVLMTGRVSLTATTLTAAGSAVPAVPAHK